MQTVTEQEMFIVETELLQPDVHIRPFPLQGVLPPDHNLFLNEDSGTLSYVAGDGLYPQLWLQEQFTVSELSLLVPLLESYPHFCPYELLYASFYNGTVTDEEILVARRRLQRALERGNWEQEMKPVRNVLSRTRLKLQHFGLTISSILETGCIVRVMSHQKKSKVA